MSVATWLGVRPPDQQVDKWHISGPVDVMAYAFSWIWVLIPVAFVGNEFRRDYLAIYILTLAITDVHRHYSFPYVYLDREVFQHFRTRYVLFPLVMVVLWLVSPSLAQSRYSLSLDNLGLLVGLVTGFVYVLRQDRFDTDVRTKSYVIGLVVALVGWFLGKTAALSLGDTAPQVKIKYVIDGVFVFAGLWNIYHVYNQKYGILRLYSAKSGTEERVPGWVDRLLIWGWLPLYLTYLTPRYHNFVFRVFPNGRRALRPVFDRLIEISAWAIWPSIGLVVFTLGAFLWFEWRTHALKNAPRLWMGIGTTILASSFLWLHPLKAYLAYAFSHAVEYIVFVWAFQRRRYHEPLPHRPLLARILTHPLLAHMSFIVVLGAAFVYFKYVGRWIFTGVSQPQLFGITTAQFVGYYTVYQSMMHFYFDGFLWKMRRSSVRANI